VSEWIAAESYGAVLGVLEELLLRCSSVEGLRESHFEVINANVQVHWRPMTFVVARLRSASGRLRACAFLEQADLNIAGAEDSHARDRFRGLRESERARVEPNGLREIRDVDPNGYRVHLVSPPPIGSGHQPRAKHVGRMARLAGTLQLFPEYPAQGLLQGLAAMLDVVA